MENMARKKKTGEDAADVVVGSEPTVVKGSHLTVTTYADGRTELEWDDEALMRDVQEAIASVETLVAVTEEKVKKIRSKKSTKEKA